MNFPLVSVVITTKNEEQNIANCLKSILKQSYPRDKIEIIVVDNNSADKTKEIAKKYTDKVFPLLFNPFFGAIKEKSIFWRLLMNWYNYYTK